MDAVMSINIDIGYHNSIGASLRPGPSSQADMAPSCAPATLSPDPCGPHTSLSTGCTYKAGAAAKEVCVEARSGLCAVPAVPPSSCPNGTSTAPHSSCKDVKVEASGMGLDAEEMSGTASPCPPAPSHSQHGMIPVPCSQTPTASPCHVRSSSSGTSLAPARAVTPPLPPTAAVQLGLGMRRSSRTCPPSSMPHAGAAPAPGAAPADTMDSISSSLLARDRSSSGSKWEPLWARTAAAAAAAALSRMTRSRASCSTSTVACKEDKDEGEEGEGVTQQRPPALAPCRTSSSDVQQQAAVALPHSLDSSSSTPTSFPVATLLSHSLLQALGSPNFPGSPRAITVAGMKAAPEQHQHTRQSIQAQKAAGCTEPATAEELSRDLVLACEASGMATADAKALVHMLVSQTDMNMDELTAALSHTLHGFATGNCTDFQQQVQQRQQQQQSEGGVSTTVPEALLPSHSMSSQLEPKGPDALPVGRFTPSKHIGFTSISGSAFSSSSLPVCGSSDFISSQDTRSGTAGNSMFSRANSHSCIWEEAGGQPRGRHAGGLLPVHDAAPPICAPRPPLQADVATSAPPHTPWDFTHLLGLLEQQGHSHNAQQQESSVHGGKQLLDWMEQHQHRQNQRQDADLHCLHVQASSPTSGMPTIPSSNSLTVLDTLSASPSPHSTLSTRGSAANATILMSPSSLAALTNDGKVGKGWEDMEDGVKERVFSVCEGCAPHVKLHHFDAGVRHWLVQLTALFGQQAAIKGLNGIVSATNLEGVRNMRAFITTRLIDHYEQLVFQQDPRGYAQRRLMPEQFELLVDLIECRSEGLHWSHFDPKVLDTVRDLCAEYTRSRLQRLSAKELATVKNVPAYIFTLLSKRGKTAKQAAAAKGTVEGALSRFTDVHFSPSIAPRTPARYGRSFPTRTHSNCIGRQPPCAGGSPLASSTTEQLYQPTYYGHEHHQDHHQHHQPQHGPPPYSKLPFPPPPPPPPPMAHTIACPQSELSPPTPPRGPPPPKAYSSVTPHPPTLIYTPPPYPHHTREALLHAVHGGPMGMPSCDPSFTSLYYLPIGNCASRMAAEHIAISGGTHMAACSDAATLPYAARTPDSHSNSRAFGGYSGFPAAMYTDGDNSIPHSSAFTTYSAPPATCGAPPPQFFLSAPFLASGGHAPMVAMGVEQTDDSAFKPTPLFCPYDGRG